MRPAGASGRTGTEIRVRLTFAMPMKVASKKSMLNAQSVRFALQREKLVAQLQQRSLVAAVNIFKLNF